MVDEAVKPVVVFAALQHANEQRSAYGLRYNDFARYRKHCANRTHRLRSTLKMTHGKGREFKKLPSLTLDIIKDGHLQLLLLEAERAWAYSQDLSSQALKPSNENHAGTLRHSATSRFRRAIHWSTQLLLHCQNLHSSGRLSTAHLLQATVYNLIVNGRFLRYKDDFEDALAQLSVARGLLDALAQHAGTSREQALYVLFADEIGPEIRHCAHELGMEKAYDVDGIVKEVSARWKEELVQECGKLLGRLVKESAGDEDRRKLTELIWEEKPVPVRNPELVDVLLKVQEAEAKLEGDNKGERKDKSSKKGVAAYDAILLALSDAEEVARKLVEAQQLNGSTSAASGAAGSRDIHFVHAYIVYRLLSRRIQRDLVLISVLFATSAATQSKASLKMPEIGRKFNMDQVDSRLYPAVVKLLDTIIQSLDQMRMISIVDDSPDLAAAIEARLSFTKAKRCLFLARCYTPLKKYAEALTLIQHANLHIRETTTSFSLLAFDPIDRDDHPFFSLNVTDIEGLEVELASDNLQFKRQWFALNGGAPDSESEVAKDYKKPLFFDIALNYVELDMERLMIRAGKQTPASATSERQNPVVEKKSVAKAKVEVEEIRAPTPELPAPSRGGLSSLLGGWWGRN